MAVEVIAGELRPAPSRVDRSHAVGKCIGETETLSEVAIAVTARRGWVEGLARACYVLAAIRWSRSTMRFA